MKKRRDETRCIFFKKNVSGPSNPPDELAQNVSKKIPFGRIIPPFFSAKVQNLAVFSFIYMIRIRFFGPGELIQRTFGEHGVQFLKFFKHQCSQTSELDPIV